MSQLTMRMLLIAIPTVVFIVLLLWMANRSRIIMADAAKEIAREVRENTAAVKALSERIDKLER